MEKSKLGISIGLFSALMFLSGYLGLTVLGDIPNAYENNKKKNKYYYYRRSYGNPVDINSSEVNKNE